MSLTPQDQQPQPVYVMQPVSPETEGASATALWLEIIFGIFSLLGIGHVYTGRVVLGILLMIGWWVFITVGVFISSLTLGIAACLFVPLYIAIPIISGIQARTYMQTKGSTGSWFSVAAVAGGGCLLVVLTIVILTVFVIGLSALGIMLGSY